MSAIKTTYKAIRSVLFTIIVIVVTFYVGLYVVLSIPAVQRSIKNRAEKEASVFLGSKVEVGSLKIAPFNELRLTDVTVYTPKGERCLGVATLGAGISLRRLIFDRKIELTYAEIIGLDGRVWKETPESPLNIDFIIKAFSPKDKNKPPTAFDVKLRNVVIRKSALSYDLRSEPRSTDSQKFDINHVALSDFKADVSLPVLKNDEFIIDLRRLSFEEKCGFIVDKLAFKAKLTPRSLDLNDFTLRLPESEIRISDQALRFSSYKQMAEALSTGNHLVQIEAPRLAPRDFRAFFTPLAQVEGVFKFDADISGNIDRMAVDQFYLRDDNNNLLLNLRADVSGITQTDALIADIDDFELKLAREYMGPVVQCLPSIKENVKGIIERLQNLDLKASGNVSMASRESEFRAMVGSECGMIEADCELEWNSAHSFDISGTVGTERFDLGKVIGNNRLGAVAFVADADVSVRGKNMDGSGEISVSEIVYQGESIANIWLKGEKKGNQVRGDLTVDDNVVSLEAAADVVLDGENSNWDINATVERLIPSRYGLLSKYSGYNLSGSVSAQLTGNTADNLVGEVDLDSFSFEKKGEPGLHVSMLNLTSLQSGADKHYELEGDFIKGSLKGNFTFAGLVNLAKEFAGTSMPALTGYVSKDIQPNDDYAKISLTISPNEEFAKFFALPVKPFADINISGIVSGENGELRLQGDAPSLMHGGKKMIRNTRLSITGNLSDGLKGTLSTQYPLKKDDVNLDLSLSALADKIRTDIGWQFERNKTATGNVAIDALTARNVLTGKPEVKLEVVPSTFRLNGSEWKVDRSKIDYADDMLNVDNLRIWHSGQFVNINGTASASAYDALRVKLAGIDLSYIFEALNINYVTFGGMATGEVLASNLFTKVPVLRTERLFVKDMSYNGTVLGDGNLESHWINDLKKVAINADIRRGSNRVALIGGGIYVGRDSLSFDMLVDKIDVGFLKPFMSAFTSDVGGRASGRVKLFGTFKDVDLTGSVMADSIGMKVDYTNVYYHGADSVYLRPGRIEIPAFRVYDKYGNSGVLRGVVKHEFFREPEFEFKLGEAQGLLGFDTDSKINANWYGRVFVDGGGTLRGRPGIVSLMLDATTSPGSDFTFVLNSTQTAADYAFLTFSDRKKIEFEQMHGEVNLEEDFRRTMSAERVGRGSIFSMDLRCSVTPAAKLTLVMDPKSGDRITARGIGPLQMAYDTESNDLQMYGKYTLDEGDYNFSLQDLILRDFKIYKGSSISFNGDPMQGILDITAAYRVNTNLSDLDKSFSTDRDLNRTNVPVDALLKVNGDIRSPEISFDIALPTLTQDVERKVKSIISTDDMMSRQIMYLLALNRFYTPEYMGATSNGGGELASVASSTLSSQLSNMMGQLTDKVTLAPSIRSDKGDFSDMEVDVALSSRLLDNRLLINGNFGYRDRSTSQSTFVGDFDIEYLLNKSGDIRLKAYNHFNDQNYYLRSALTTQGIGIIYRKDFDNPFTFLKRRKKKADDAEDAKKTASSVGAKK